MTSASSPSTASPLLLKLLLNASPYESQHQARLRLPLRPDLPRRSHAPPRPRRGPHPHRPQLRAWEGGGEYNTSRGLRKCFGLRTAVVHRLRRQRGRPPRRGLHHAGRRRHRLHQVARGRRHRPHRPQRPQLHRARLRHPRRRRRLPTAATPPPASSSPATSTGITSSASSAPAGSTPAASSLPSPTSTAALTIEAVKAAKKHGTIVSYDLNYRPSLWKTIGGLKKAQEVNREIAKYVDVMIGNEEDFTASLGFEVKGADHNISHIETDAFKAMIETAVKGFPQLQGRRHHPASRHHRHDQRLERHPLARRQVLREPQVSGTRDPRPRRRRRQLRQRPAVRFPRVQRRPEGRRIRRRPRRPRLHHPR
jgi:hypothetical protein